ncbi:DUF2452 domain-containing protein [Bacteroidia bacterium]|nr:DUF2452 domain-containing protein [Bacteroidia bacterium]MDB4107086.1 DUF2452 domain-containing protein [Bacteroidia bacterium]MDB9882610.1 DUF2452 domain-containing protein [Bacteroidia bacterium]MDC1395122.1 DUF2452 domain-containing protein [Bacteroidia bacterium]
MPEEKKDSQYYKGEAKFSPIPLIVSSPVIKAENKGKIKASAVETMQKQANQQIAMLRKQADTIMQQVREIEARLQVSYGIYEAEMKFTPKIGENYHLYEKDGGKILSFISPDEWGERMPYDSFLATVHLLADRTWEVKVSNDEGGLMII